MKRFHPRIARPALALIALTLAGCNIHPAPPPALEVAQLFPVPRTVPGFTLTRSDGQPLMHADWKGRYTLVFMGYTHCPDICPTTLLTLRSLWGALRKAGLTDRVAVEFISVDPGRDTPKRLAEYVHWFDPAFTGATGSAAELDKISRALMLPFKIVPGAHGGYSVDHSATLAIIGPDAREIGVFMPPLHAAPMAADLKRLLAWKS
jgi:protein SCO1/2